MIRSSVWVRLALIPGLFTFSSLAQLASMFITKLSAFKSRRYFSTNFWAFSIVVLAYISVWFLLVAKAGSKFLSMFSNFGSALPGFRHKVSKLFAFHNIPQVAVMKSYFDAFLFCVAGSKYSGAKVLAVFSKVPVPVYAAAFVSVAVMFVFGDVATQILESSGVMLLEQDVIFLLSHTVYT